MTLVPPYQIHRAWAEGDAPAAFFCVHIGIDEPFMLRTMCRLRRPFFPAASETAQAVRPQMELLERCARAPDNSLALRMRRVSAMFDLLAVLADATATLIDERSEAELKAERFADQLATAMEARVAAGQEIGIGALCQQFGVSTSHGNLLFRTVYGMAPRDYASRVCANDVRGCCCWMKICRSNVWRSNSDSMNRPISVASSSDGRACHRATFVRGMCGPEARTHLPALVVLAGRNQSSLRPQRRLGGQKRVG
jgi:hypothetical protein